MEPTMEASGNQSTSYHVDEIIQTIGAKMAFIQDRYGWLDVDISAML